ncbi:TonB-linked SusC/RagA family outer membrane protein [Epilithonimonas hungarica]|uniref:SusC/RagA family TonB-linked outer membrane protein n=1 Tax=Epilithonimonas hungarica TaxID=454006 RepID=UPI002781AC1B|nr:TonB-dependent receptor [Epilithonimonas hungarica]MDP9955639.1 TonB-linked SusC/RagA family outer membrane protein [Epilithonimonas hungarica]
MNLKYSKCLGLAAVLYFTANYSAQQRVSDTASKEKLIEEVVVIGYGTQKKSNVTGAIASLKASDIEDIPAGKPEQVLQGRAAGVSVVTNSGQPGSAATVRVRGITSFGAGSNDPLWVVDGIVVDNIAWLNQSDIESMEILKDAASAAIYGVSSAKGVILVTTKKGKKGKLTLNYNGSYGVSSAARKLDLLNATQYATIMNEATLNGDPNAQLMFSNPQSLGKGTDWQDVIFKNASRNNHEFSLNGGSEKSSYYASFGYFDQEGIVMPEISKYKRINARLNSTHKVFDFLTIGQTFSYTHSQSQGINANEEFGGPLSSAINLDPITPVVVTDISSQMYPSDYSNQYIVKDPNGNPYGISHWVNQEMANPLAFQYTQLGHKNWDDNFVGNVFAEFKFLDHFTFRPTLNGKKAFWGYQGFTPLYYLSPTMRNIEKNNLNRTMENKFEWSSENTLTYQNKWGKHNLTALVGASYYHYNISQGQSTTYSDLPVDNWEDASFNFDVDKATNRSTNAWDGIEVHKSSYFGRILYDYDNRYLFTGTIRRDGSSIFGPNHRWGNFPAFSLGWNVSNENFWGDNKVITSLKFRGGYGVSGNDAIPTHRFASFMVDGFNYTNGGNVVVIGYGPSTLANPDLHWEETTQANIATDMKLFNDFSLTVDVYQKKSTDILRQVSIPGYVGVANDPWRNIGDMKNLGIETELGYSKNWDNFGLSVKGNFSYLKNEITRLEDNKEFVNSASFQSMGPVSRFQVGYSYGSFFGYQTAGIFQNQAEIDAYKNSNGGLIQPDAKPGDFRWQDTNGDGKIDANDIVYLGNSIPKYTYGFTVNMNYQNFDIMLFAQGQAGNKLFQGLRRLDMLYANYQTSILDRWTGEGTSNDTPRVTTKDDNGNYTKMSNYYLQKGDYLRLKIIQIGYTLPKSVSNSFGASKVRFYVTGENIFTFTKYTGYDPEIAGRNNSEQDVLGIDRAYYPQARTFLFGANIQF